MTYLVRSSAISRPDVSLLRPPAGWRPASINGKFPPGDLIMKVLSLIIGGALISAATLAVAQTTESPRIFTGSNSTQTVQAQQQGTGMAIKGSNGLKCSRHPWPSHKHKRGNLWFMGGCIKQPGNGSSRRIECHNWRRGRSWHFSRIAGWYGRR